MAFKQNKDGQIKWIGAVSKTVKGKKYRKQKSFSSKREAVAWEVESRKAMDEGSAVFPVTHSDFSETTALEWANEYLEYAKRFVPKTQAEKRSAFKAMFAAKGKDGLPLVQPSQTAESISKRTALLVVSRVAETHSNNRANKDRKNLAAAWEYGIEYLNFKTLNPFKAIPVLGTEVSLPYTPTEKDFWQVVSVSEGQDKLMLMAYWYLAARRCELFRLKWDDVDFSRESVQIRSRKNKSGTWRIDVMPLPKELKEALFRHRMESGGVNEYVFVSPRTGKPYVERNRWISQLCDKAGVKRFGYHGIRRLSASMLADMRVPMKHIQSVLRHTKLATTELYIRQLGHLPESLDKMGERSQFGKSTAEGQNQEKRVYAINT